MTYPTDSGRPVSTRRRDGLITHRAARSAVDSELRGRGYEVSFTTVDAKQRGDIVVTSPARKSAFLVNVKGLYRRNPWIIKPRQVRDDLFYVLALVPDDAPSRFFVLTQEQVNVYVHEEQRRLHRPADYPASGVLLRQIRGHEDDWRILPR